MNEYPLFSYLEICVRKSKMTVYLFEYNIYKKIVNEVIKY